mmetsp:Transcript_42707/g.93172  ORF Transcript_42707/g.93172 Transcript_42707/m.93172 type:complete len:250 (-) Transcript_42707:139-888(-)
MSQGAATLARSFNKSTNYAASSKQKPTELWNPDSNISSWTLHTIHRDGAEASWSVHRHSQKRPVMLSDKSGKPKECTSGMVLPGDSFLETWGYDLGSRDRHGRKAAWWRPTGHGEMFRSKSSYVKAPKEKWDGSGTAPSGTGGVDGGDPGQLYGSVSCTGWHDYRHCALREAAKQSFSVHRKKDVKFDHPSANCEMRPAAIYTKVFQDAAKSKNEVEGHKALRSFLQDHVDKGRNDNLGTTGRVTSTTA